MRRVVWTNRARTLARKLIAGSEARRTRLHDALGNRVSLSRLARNGPPALWTGLGRLILGRRPTRPWISYDGQRALERRLTRSSRVLEFGSGTSTVWLAERSKSVLSVENHRPWYGKVSRLLDERGVANVTYRFASDADDYADAAAEETEGFDVILIDGSRREACLRRSLDRLRPGGCLYLDNTDTGCGEQSGDMPAARSELLAFAERKGARVTVFTDFAPTQLFVQQGMLVDLPPIDGG